MKNVFKAAVLSFLILLPSLAARAQDVPAAPESAPAAAVEEKKAGQFKDSLFLSSVEVTLIRQALKGKVSTPESLKVDAAAAPTHRLIEVSGIVYRAPQDWIVWVNGEKVTPKKLLPQIVAIQVRDSSQVSMKWFNGRNVVAVTMRPRQVYDTMTRTVSTVER